MKNLYFKRAVLSLLLLTSSYGAQADESIEAKEVTSSEQLIPAISPQKNCSHPLPRVPEGIRDYRYLTNESCDAYFVLPPSINKHSIDSYALPNLGYCTSLATTQESIETIRKTQARIDSEIFELTEQLFASKSPEERAAIEEKIDLSERLLSMLVNNQESAESSRERLGSLRGGIFNVVLDSRILRSDLDKLERFNERFPMTDQNLPNNMVQRVPFIPATLHDSMYSFVFRAQTPESNANQIILSSNLPGLEHLNQVGSSNSFAHVYGRDVISGEVVLSLNGTCGYETKIAENRYEFKENRAPFVVNQSYAVQKQFLVGYSARLNHQEVAQMTLDRVKKMSNNGFTKEQVIDQLSELEFDKLIQFEWSENYTNNETQEDLETIRSIKEAVLDSFVEKYYERLVFAGLLEIVDSKPLEAVDGGYVDADQIGTKCTSRKRNWFGRTRQTCFTHVYKVKEWRDGSNSEQIMNDMNLDMSFEELFSARQMVPLHYTSTFVSPKQYENFKKQELN